MDRLEFDAEIIDVKWPTNTKGELTPILVLDKEYCATKKDDEQKFDGIAFVNVSLIRDKRCGIGSKVKIKCNDQLVPDIEEVYEKSDRFKFPKKCMYCSNEVQSFNNQYICINHLCPAQGRSAIFKLVILANLKPLDRQSVIDLHQYLNKFPYKGSTSNIEHIYEYLKMLQEIFPSIPTEKRKQELIEVHGKNGAGNWMFEFSLWQKLQKGFSPSDFWYLLGLPFKDKDYDKISKFNVFEDGLNSKKLKRLKLSDHGYKVVEDNTGYIKLIYPELERFIS